MGFVHHLALEGVASAFLLHDVDVERLHEQAHFTTCLECMVVLHQQLIAFLRLHPHLEVHTLEDTAGHRTCQLSRIRGVEDIDVFRTDNHIHRRIGTEALIDTVERTSGKAHLLVLNHRTVEDVTFTDKVGHEGIGRFIINIHRSTNLLNLALAHHHDGITQRKRLFLVMRYIHEGDAQLLVHFLQFHLHVLAHLQVERSQRFVQQQHFRLIHDGTRNSHTLLLST